MRLLVGKDGHLSPLMIQLTGWLLFIAMVVFWALTGRLSEVLIGASLTLIGVGAASGAIQQAKQEIERANSDREEK